MLETLAAYNMNLANISLVDLDQQLGPGTQVFHSFLNVATFSCVIQILICRHFRGKSSVRLLGLLSPYWFRAS